MILATTWLGTLPAWLTFAGVIAVAYMFHGSPPGAALEIEQRANKTLASRVEQLEAAQKVDRETIATLLAKTDITLAITPLIDWCKAHEVLAQARSDEILARIARGA